MTNLPNLNKFSDCSGCLFVRSRQCRTCDSGEFFQERDHEIVLENRYPRDADLRRLDPNQIDKTSGERDE